MRLSAPIGERQETLRVQNSGEKRENSLPDYRIIVHGHTIPDEAFYGARENTLRTGILLKK